MTNDQLAVVNDIDQYIAFGSDEIVIATSPVEYADHAAVICSVIGDIDLFQQYPRVWEALFGLVDFEYKQAHEFITELQSVELTLNMSENISAHVTSLWLSTLRVAAQHELDQFGYIASTRVTGVDTSQTPVSNLHVFEPTDTEGHSLQCSRCATSISIHHTESWNHQLEAVCPQADVIFA